MLATIQRAIQRDGTRVVGQGNEVTLKKACRQEGAPKLEGANGSYEIMESRRVENLGRVVLARHWLKVS